MDKLIKNVNKLTYATSTIAGVILVADVLLVIVNIIMRRLFNTPIFGASELICYAALIAAAFAFLETDWLQINVEMTLLHEKVSERAGDILRFITTLFSAVVFVYVSYTSISDTINKYTLNNVSTELMIPLFIPSIFVSASLICITILLFLKTAVRGYGLKNHIHYHFSKASEAEEAAMISENNDTKEEES